MRAEQIEELLRSCERCDRRFPEKTTPACSRYGTQDRPELRLLRVREDLRNERKSVRSHFGGWS